MKGGRFACRVEGWVGEAGRVAVGRVGKRDEAGPERSDGAGAANHRALTVDADDVAGGGVGIAGNVGQATAAGAPRRGGYVGVGLPAGFGEEGGDAAAGGALIRGEFVPHRLAGDRVARDAQIGAAAGEHVGAGGREIDVIAAIGDAVRGAVVAAGHRDGDAERSGGLKCLVHGGEGLLGPGGLGAAPGDGDHGRFAGGVMDGGRDGVEEALIGVRGKVHGEGCAGSDRAGDLDVQQHLAVSAAGVFTGNVLGFVDGDGIDRRRGQLESPEVGFDVGGRKASSELDDADGLAGRADPRKFVDFADLNGRVGGIRGTRAGDAEVRFGLWAVVEAEHGADVRREFLRQGQRALADAQCTAFCRVRLDLGAKGFLEVFDGAGKLDRSARRLQFGVDLEVVLRGESFDERNGLRVCAMLGLKLLVREANPAEGAGVDRSFAANQDRDGDVLAFGTHLRGRLVRGGKGKTGVVLGGKGLAIAAWEGNSGLLGEAGRRHIVGASCGVGCGMF